MKEIFELMILILFLLACLFGLLFVVNYLNEKQCANNVTEMNLEYRYDFINGCRIGLEDGTFVYWEMYRVNQ